MPMRNTRMTPQWVAEVTQRNPIKIAEKTGNIITCPVRLAFINLLKPAKPQPTDPPDKVMKYNTLLLFPPGCEAQFNGIIAAMHYQKVREEFASHIDPQSGVAHGLHSPFHDQADKAMKYSGFTPGLQYFSASSQFKPSITDTAGNPIVDDKRVYAGVWAIVALNCYGYGKGAKGPTKKGVGFGLQNVMLFADDESFGGAGTDPRDDFAGVQVDSSFQAPAAFGNAPMATPGFQHGAPAPGIMPPPQQVQQYQAPPPAYAPPQAYAPPPPAPGQWAPPPAPRQWAPPVAPAEEPLW